MLKLFNTLGQKKRIFHPQNKKKVTMYTCGPTVYDFAHIGNFRAYLFADFLYRYLHFFKGYEVEWVMNITDIDDKTIQASKKQGNPNANLIEFTRKYESTFFEDLHKLSLGIDQKNPSKNIFKKNPRATEHIEEMQDLIRRIIKKKLAYIKEGSVYFDLVTYRKKQSYGQLIHIDFEGFQNGVRIDSDEYTKENLKDFVLWKAQKNDEPSFDFMIDGKNFPGRPGWHIECSAMSHKHLGSHFDIHTGGVDLKFPHHENEIAQSIAGFGENPATFWCHNEHLMVEGKKMSKSLGNFYTLRDLEKKGYDPRYFRYFVTSNHYRTKLNFTFEALNSAKNALERIEETIQKLLDIQKNAKKEKTKNKTSDKKENLNDRIKITRKNIEKELDDDLNTTKALAHLFSFIKKVNTLLAKKKITKSDAKKIMAFLKKMNLLFDSWHFKKTELDPEMEKLIQERDKARTEKQFEKADSLRKLLQEKGIELEDTPGGTIWRKKITYDAS
ncbi:cysteine--tRNA ligase [Candidatus Peregrinibacteria bacterium]|nr:cysteine--tRNA ligase [Candidatus Peregrinibacteria bacterium]